jgi:hypothetical protein
MKTLQRTLLLALLSGFIFLTSCERLLFCHESNVSMSGAGKSHNKGENCMQCHKAGGEGEGCFNAAGTVYQSNLQNTISSGSVAFYTGPDGTGTLKYTLAIDGKGNFYSTNKMDVSGLYPVVTGPNGNASYMGSALTSGACNSCHNQSTSKISVN